MPKRSAAALIALATLTSGCLAARSQPKAEAAPPVPGLQVSVDEAFYRIDGRTAPQLNLELARRGPVHGGARWQGLTDFRMVYSYEVAPGADGCRAAEPRVSVRVVTTLPTWTDRDAAPEWLRADWDLFLGRLRRHEEGHQRIAIGEGEALLQEFASLAAPDCESLRRNAVELAEAARESVVREQEWWDAETDHGRAGG